jgi:hypothetical protein
MERDRACDRPATMFQPRQPFWVSSWALVGIGLLVPRVVTPLRLSFHFHDTKRRHRSGSVRRPARVGADAVHLIDIPSTLDPYPAVGDLSGHFLDGGDVPASLGLLVSGLVRDQMVAAILAIAFCLPFVLAGFLGDRRDRGPRSIGLACCFSVPLHFDRAWARGVASTRVRSFCRCR